MPTIQGLLRRRGQGSDLDIRRHSFYFGESASNPTVVFDGRASEQIPRRPSAAEFLSPDSAVPALSITRTTSSEDGIELQRAVSPEVQEATPKHHRFSMLKFRHASDSQLATRARLQAQSDSAPPIPHRKIILYSECLFMTLMLLFLAPEIITTAPTMDITKNQPTKKKSKVRVPGLGRPSFEISREGPAKLSKNEKKERRKTMSESGPSGSKTRVTFDEPDRPMAHGNSPPAYGDEASSTLALPLNRLSESSRSDASSGDHGVYATTTTTTHTVHTTTTFFRLPRRKKPAPLFDLSHL